MAQRSNYQIATVSEPELSGIKSQKLMSSVFEGKGPSDYESSWSPTSPLDFRLFSSLGNPFGGSSSMSIWKGKQKGWNSGKVGLNIVHSLDDEMTDSSRIVLPSPDSKNIIFESLMRCGNPKSHLPNPMLDDVIDVVDHINASEVIKQATGSLNGHSESDIEISEDYTCVTSHGPNPKTTYFYGDQVLEHKVLKKKESLFEIAPLDLTTPDNVLPPNDFLSFCYGCNKNLGMGKDIYMYRGYKAFCSSECRSEEILKDEEMEDEEANKSVSVSDKDLSEKKSTGVVFTIG